MVAELEFLSLARDLLDIQERIYDLNLRKKNAEMMLRECCNNKTFESSGYKYEAAERKGSIQYEDIPGIESVDLDEYRGDPVRVWKLSYHKQFEL